MPPGGALSAGDSVVFALARSQDGLEPSFVRGGDSVRVLLTDVAELGTTDPATGQALYQLSWVPLGQVVSPSPATGRARKTR